MQGESRWRRLTARLRWIHAAPLLALMTLGAWAFASPVGASPDDDYHLVSTWCALGGSEACTEVEDYNLRQVSTAFDASRCYAMDSDKSAACQAREGLSLDGPTVDSPRGNFQNKYPDVFYGTMRLFAGDDLVRSALVMRLVNVTLFVGLATALAALMSSSRRQTLLWGWLVTMVPLGLFLIPSNNPSSWSITGVGTAFIALLGWYESHGKRRWALGAMYVVGIVMAAGSRSDGAIYAAGATLVAALLTSSRNRDWLIRSALPFAGLVVILLLFLTTNQADVGVDGISGGGSVSTPGSGSESVAEPTGGFALTAYNLLMVPYLWTGVWGTWALGWFDTVLPSIVPWAASAAFIAVAFAGLALLTWRKVIATVGVLTVLTAFPVYLLTAGGDVVGDQFQPRYLLPLIVLFAFVLVTAAPGRRTVRFTRVQTAVLLGALALANLVALQVNIRRYVTGADTQGFNLGAGAEWWWHGAFIGPTGVWLIGSLSFAALLAVLWPELRRKVVAEPLEAP
ncbi:DUF2142 domain-containing protein [Demequina sp. TTPB684]|uniref:DUF2142 domain-containing protein n=1 Tax=unclassified Demequina TaxID=2620311 RepID=UPI001CF11876|nr:MULTISPECIES: DUF2142 domain-containing protein [unclassified Demequina]MCB2413620.1 DUF2142 domain-containing protein [Demequina sp. TTPB684]UPU89769.1 DUF2142 domain-containing protein [Demequina sp. TMPB413]